MVFLDVSCQQISTAGSIGSMEDARQNSTTQLHSLDCKGDLGTHMFWQTNQLCRGCGVALLVCSVEALPQSNDERERIADRTAEAFLKLNQVLINMFLSDMWQSAFENEKLNSMFKVNRCDMC